MAKKLFRGHSLKPCYYHSDREVCTKTRVKCKHEVYIVYEIHSKYIIRYNICSIIKKKNEKNGAIGLFRNASNAFTL